MHQLLHLGAINKKTRKYVYPTIANKKDEYVCPDCDKCVFPRQGKVLRHHFAHKRSNNPCNYYNNPGESQIHKDGKMLIKTLLENKTPITFIRKCCNCPHEDEFDIPEVDENSIIQMEHRFEYNDVTRIADVAYIDDNALLCIFEICNTHKTSSENRPTNIEWFEIDAKSIINMVNKNEIASLIKIPCIRDDVKCDKCIERKNIGILKLARGYNDDLSTITELDFRGKYIHVEGAQEIASALPSLPNLTRLAIDENGIGVEGAKAIASALPSLPNLTSLNVCYNQIGAEGAKAIASALPSLPNLTRLAIDENGIGVEGAIAIASALPSLPNLTRLGIRYNEIGVEGAQAIKDAKKEQSRVRAKAIKNVRCNVELGTGV